MHLNGVLDIKYIIFCFLILGYFIYQGFCFYKVFTKNKFCIWAVFRLITIVCLMLVLIKVEVIFTSQNTTTLFLVDRSLSVDTEKNQIEGYINKQIKYKKVKDDIGVITFGKNPMIEVPITNSIDTVRLQTKVDKEFTNIEKALFFTINYFPENKNKRLVIFTDGNENVGEYSNVREYLNEKKINLIVYPLKTKVTKDVQLTDIHIPTNVHKGETVPLTATIDSKLKTEGTFYAFEENKKVIEKSLKVNEGTNEFKFQVPINKNGNINFRGEIKFKEDNNPKNNSFKATAMGKIEPRILVIGEKEDTNNLDNLLDSLKIKHKNYSSSKVPDTLSFLSDFDSIYMVNVSHKNITKDFENNLEACVKEQGTGLFLIGGENTFALGEYKNSTLEKMLPVKCTMKGNKKQPNTGLVLVIDASGSMEDESGGIKKIEMAKEAAIRSIEILNKDDYVGVLAFSDRVEWIVPFEKVINKEKIKEDIGKLGSKGGTLIKPALNKSLEILKNTDTKVKHIILLTDGQGEKKGYESLIDSFKDNKITVSTVAFGKDSDKYLLKNLSKSTKGRDYFAIDFHSIPEIFARETYIATKKYLNNREFTPKIVNQAEFFNENSIPKLNGYVGTGIKERANLVLKSDRDDPILAYWKYGLGNVVVWTPDLNGKWSHSFVDWSGFQKLWSKIINYCFSSNNGKNIDVQITQKDANVNLFVDALSKDSGLMVDVIVQGPENIKREISLNQVMTGCFKGDFILDKKGDYALTFRLKKNGEIKGNTTRMIHLNYCPEYGLVSSDNLQNMYLATDSYVLDKNINLFELPIERKNKGQVPLDFILLPLALICFIGDIWIRKR